MPPPPSFLPPPHICNLIDFRFQFLSHSSDSGRSGFPNFPIAMPIRGLSSSSSSSFSTYYSSSSRFTTKRLTLMAMGKTKSHSPSPPDKEPPPRITSNVKQNLQFLKQFQKKTSSYSSASSSRPTTSYRRKKPQKDQTVVQDTENHDDFFYHDPSTTIYDSDQGGVEEAIPVLLVDGYNVCGYWTKLKTHFLQGRLDLARQSLIDELLTFGSTRKDKVVVVFDAMDSGLPTHKENFLGIDVVYTGESSADAWIEKEVAALKKDGCPEVRVVTSDRCQQHAAHGAGAFIWSSKAFVSEIKASREELHRRFEGDRPHSFEGRLLKHNLDSKVVDTLKDMRDKLLENERRRKR